MTRQEQATAAGAIYGVIALLLLAFCGACVYAAFTSPNNVAPAVVPAIGLLGLMGCGATLAACYAFHSAMRGGR